MTDEEFASNFLFKKNELMNSKVSDLTIRQLEMLFCMWENEHLSIEKSTEKIIKTLLNIILLYQAIKLYIFLIYYGLLIK